MPTKFTFAISALSGLLILSIVFAIGSFLCALVNHASVLPAVAAAVFAAVDTVAIYSLLAQAGPGYLDGKDRLSDVIKDSKASPEERLQALRAYFKD